MNDRLSKAKKRLGGSLEKTSLQRAAREVLSEFADQSGQTSVIVAIEPVSESRFEPSKHVLHQGRLSGLGAQIEDLVPCPGEQAQLRAALLSVTQASERDSPFDALGPKEVLYLDLLCDGLSDEEAAAHLSISLRAVKTRKRVICEKTRSATISQAIAGYIHAQKTRRPPNAADWPGEAAAELMDLDRVDRSIRRLYRGFGTKS